MRLIVAVVALAASLAAPARAVEPGGWLTGVDWLRKPTGEDMALVYPRLAQPLDMEGRAIIGCKVQSDGTLANCEVVEETPRGLGFGAASKLLAPLFRMRPQLADGRPVAGGSVKIPISYRLPKGPPPEPVRLPTATAERLALGRQLVDVQQLKQAMESGSAAERSQLERFPSLGVDNATRTALLDLIRTADARVVARVLEAQAQIYGASFTADELNVLIAQHRRPIMRLYADQVLRHRERYHQAWGRHQRRVVDVAQMAFCNEHGCAALPAPTPPIPVWARQPNNMQMRRAAPPAARLLDLEGAARLKCAVNSVGALEACGVVDETPRGLGVGPAALTAAPLFQLEPPKGGAQGSSVIFDVILPGLNINPGDVPPSGADAATLALARELVGDDLPADVETTLAEYLDYFAGGRRSDPAIVQIEGLLRKAAKNDVPLLRDDLGAMYAALFSKPELEQLVRWRKSPEALKLAKLEKQQGQVWQAVYREAQASEFLTARIEACRMLDCDPIPAPRPKP